MPNEIPTKRRDQVRARESGRCIRCQGPGREQHHRRRRRVQDDHTHCSCNLVLLCVTCHRWVHAQPRLAQAESFILNSTTEYPGDIPVAGHLLTCDGSYRTENPNAHEG